jgi:VCBS repeat-containing protein
VGMRLLKLLILSILISTSLITIATPKEVSAADWQIAGYLQDWSMANAAGDPYALELEKTTFTIFTCVRSDGLDPTIHARFSWDYLTQVVDASHAKGVKAILSFAITPLHNGLDQMMDAGRDDLVEQVADNLVALVEQYNFDGAGLDWETGEPQSYQNNFAAILGPKLQAKGKMLVMAASWYRYDISLSASQYMDYIMPMCYDFWRQTIPSGYTVCADGGAAGKSQYNDAVAVMDYWIQGGYPKSKLLMGVNTGQNADAVGQKAQWVVDNNLGGMMIFELYYDSGGTQLSTIYGTFSIPTQNQPPVLAFIGSKSVKEEQALEFTVSATDPDGDNLSYSANLTSLPSEASFDPATQTFSWTPSLGQAGTYNNVHFEVSDGELTDSEDITITVLEASANSPPVFDLIGDKSVSEEQLLEFIISATDPDGDNLTYSANLTSLPPEAIFDPETQTFSWTPSLGQAGTYNNVRFEVSDGELTDSEDIAIIVNLPLTIPLRVNTGGGAYIDTLGNTWLSDQAYTSGDWGFYGENYTVDRGAREILGTEDDRIYQTERWALGGYLFDLPNGTYDVVLHFAETYAPGVGRRVFDVSVQGQLVLDELDIYNEVGMDAALVKIIPNVVVSDGQLNIAITENVDLSEINGIEIFAAAGNQPPITVNDNYTMLVDDILIVTAPGVLTNDYDADSDPISAVLVEDVSDGTLSLDADGSFTYMPDPGYSGTDSFVYQASDGEANSNNATVTINISMSNHAPVLQPIGNQSVLEGQTLQFTVNATDPDDDPLTYSAIDLPDGASFDTETLAFSWTPGSGQAGTYNNVHFEVSDGSLTDSEDITITVNNTGGSGGGGGGGGGSSSVTGVTSLYNSVDSSGVFLEDTEIQSADRKVEIFIPKDTICTNNDGRTPGLITIKEENPPPPPPEDAEIIGLAYDISTNPNDVIFDPPIDLIFDYEDEEIPQGVVENNLVIATYNWDTQQWEPLECTIYPEEKTIIAKLSHFSTYTILAYVRPASFEITDLLVVPGEIELGEKVSISALVTNTGDLTDIYQVNLALDGIVLRTREITLNGGESEAVAFSANPETTGLHQVSIDDFVASFTVSQPQAPVSAFTISEINVTPTEVYPGDSVEISILVSNTSKFAGSYEVILKIDNVVIQSREITLASDGSDIVTFSVVVENTGQHTINIGDKLAIFNVESGVPVTEVKYSTGPEIKRFNITPFYDNKTSELISIRIDYQVNKAEELEPGDELFLGIYYQGQPRDEVQLLTLIQLQADEETGDVSYIPSQGWSDGTYIFQVELHDGDGHMRSMQMEKFRLITESVTKKVSWGSLGIIIGVTLIVVAAAVAFYVLYRRRDMIRDYIIDDYTK